MEFFSEKVFYSSKKNWDEFIEVTFVNIDNSYLALSSLIYEDNIQIEIAEQQNFINFLKSDFKFRIDDGSLLIEIDKIQKQSNLNFSFLKINFKEDTNQQDLLDAMKTLATYQS